MVVGLLGIFPTTSLPLKIGVADLVGLFEAFTSASLPWKMGVADLVGLFEAFTFYKPTLENRCC